MRKRMKSKDLLNVLAFLMAASANGLPVDEVGQFWLWASSGGPYASFFLAELKKNYAQDDERVKNSTSSSVNSNFSIKAWLKSSPWGMGKGAGTGN